MGGRAYPARGNEAGEATAPAGAKKAAGPDRAGSKKLSAERAQTHATTRAS